METGGLSLFFSSGNSPNPIHVFWSLLYRRMWSKAECSDPGEHGGSDPVVGTFLKERRPRFLSRVTRSAQVSWKRVQSASCSRVFVLRSCFWFLRGEKKKKAFTAWLLAYRAAEAISSKVTSPPLAAGGVFVGLPSLVPAPRSKCRHPSPWRQGFSRPLGHFCLCSGGAWAHTLSLGSPLLLPLALWPSTGIRATIPLFPRLQAAPLSGGRADCLGKL